MSVLKRLNKREYMMKSVMFLVLTVLILWSICSIKANAAQRAENDKTEYQLQEVQLKSEIRDCLEKMGYKNCGITITKVIDADGSREYTVLVHHQYLDINNTDKVNIIYENLMAIDTEEKNMTVNYTIF